MRRTIQVWNTDMSNPGKRGVHKTCSRKDLERTALDYLTMDPDADFCEAQCIVEEATKEELIEMIWKFQNSEEYKLF